MAATMATRVVRKVTAEVRADYSRSGRGRPRRGSDSAGSHWRDDVLQETIEHFERRLTEEVGGLRVEMAHMKMDLRQDIAAARVDILRWSFVFWIGQVAAVIGLLAFMLRMR